jgi:hypothetical protein
VRHVEDETGAFLVSIGGMRHGRVERRIRELIGLVVPVYEPEAKSEKAGEAEKDAKTST